MAITPKGLSQNQLTAADVTQYTAPSSPATTTRLQEILLANTDTVERTVTVNLVRSGGSVAASNQILPGVAIPANGMFQYPLQTVLNPGDFISAKADVAAKVNMTLSGAEIA